MIFSLPASAIDVGTSESYRQQEFESWGTSLVWFGNSLGTWSNQQSHDEVMDLLFDGPNNLGLNYARYNIAGGQNRLLLDNFRQGAAIPGWVPTAPSSVTDTSTWEWNWNADPGQRKSLDSAIARGVNRVDAIAYSAPYWMTNSLDAAGAVDGGLNLQTSLYDEYAHYHSEILKHFRDELGVRFGNFSPMNEPNGSWWVAGGQLEGMHVSQGLNQRLLIETIGQTLVAKGLDIGITAAEESAVIETENAFNQYDSTTLSYVKQINTHGYGGLGGSTLASMQRLRNLATAQGLPIYQSEYGNNSVGSLQGGIELANRITADINLMGVSGWTYWQAVEPVIYSGAGWGLLWADYNINGSLTEIRPQYHAMRQFTSHIRPGATILSTVDDETVAAHNPGSNSTVLVFTNDETTADTNVYNLIDQTPTFTRVIRTDDSGNYASLGPGNVTGNQITVNSPGSSVTTIVAHHQPNLIQNATFDGNAGWTTSGNANFDATVDNTQDSTGGMVLQTNHPANSGAVWQAGIGNSSTDLTGKAYEFSLDVLMQNNAGQFGADTYVGLAFYGADGHTLTHTAQLDYAEHIRPIIEDSTYRVFRTDVVTAPVGTRFVRPFVSFGSVATGKTGLAYLDNAYLQETRFVPRARKWKQDADGSWEAKANWQDDALVEKNTSAYFGPHITSPRTITMNSAIATTGITFDSEFGYHLESAATLSIGDEAGIANVDVRSGSHLIDVPSSLTSETVFQVVGQSSLEFVSPLNLAGQQLQKAGPGQLNFAGGLDMDGGTLGVVASLQPTVSVGSNSQLDGTLSLSLAPGQQPAWGDLYTLADLASNGQTFDEIALPTLSNPLLDWEVKYLQSSQLVAEVVNRADFDRDGRISGKDLTQWQTSYAANAQSDANGNGLTDGGDFLLWQQLLGQAAASNTLVLTVDPTSGEVIIENLSPTDFSIDAYTISSASGSLLTSWVSLEDQGLPGWIETLPSPERLSELNPSSELVIAAGGSLSLAGLLNPTLGLADLEFQFRDTSLGTVNGRVVYANLTASVAASRIVPEPATLMLLATACFLSIARRSCTISDNEAC